MAPESPVRSLRAYLDLLRARGQLHEFEAEVDPRLEIPEIHRRVIADGGPALLCVLVWMLRDKVRIPWIGTKP